MRKSKWIISPSRGEHKKIFEVPPPSFCLTSSWGIFFLHLKIQKRKSPGTPPTCPCDSHPPVRPPVPAPTNAPNLTLRPGRAKNFRRNKWVEVAGGKNEAPVELPMDFCISISMHIIFVFKNGIHLYQIGHFNLVNVGFLMISRYTISSIHRDRLGAS